MNGFSFKRYPLGKTNTGKALEYTRRRLFKYSRRRAKKVLILLTDGKPHDKCGLPARRLRSMGVEVFAFGIGKRYKVQNLLQIATDRRHVYTAGFRNLVSLVRVLKTKICRKGRLHYFSHILTTL